MHPQLEAERFVPCQELIDALEHCHKQDYISRALWGLCNDPKEALSRCLHETRLSQVREKIIVGKEKQKGLQAKWREAREGAYGKDEKLKKVIDAEYALKYGQKPETTAESG
ncbi:hypothetical protein BABINDRAFT_38218 [Babjeviella inositovora NRRL Y-12698]|uniref:COX assembly mitochondrial protein n=1 Tax=Babjeviella inositovora NRRL Y-12698 TaxID=984486 RepID=A0A1E3QNK0_9ASCO|nr:uncharacterized protein BABINDRAFT_38218 [Babjeviella inositovora NRRL Y-12698]ODQ79286.1 hypothetical protein BABINDRAFT_38218 [Babjeviella inositovora NRRL Y-12698]